MLLTLFLEVILSVIAVFGIFMLIYKIFAKSYRECKKEEQETEKEDFGKDGD